MTSPAAQKNTRRILFFGLLLIAALLGGCAQADEVTETPPPSTETPPVVPTLSPTMTPEPTPTPSEEEDAEVEGPVVLDRFRAAINSDVTAIYPLAGQITHPVRIEIVVLEGEVDPALLIFNADGAELASADSGGGGDAEAIPAFEFPGEGMYELGIAANWGSGEVGVTITQLAPAEVDGGGTFVSLDEEARGTLSQPESTHSYRLPVARGQRFDVWAQPISEGLDLQFELYGPDGNLLAAQDDNVGLDPYLWNFMPGVSGLYTLIVSGYGDTTGDYVVCVSPSQGGEAAVIDAPTQIELLGSPRRSTWLTLEGAALDGVRVEARPLSPLVDVIVSFFDANGNRLMAINAFGGGQPETLSLVQFPYDGIYQVEFLTVGSTGDIEYLIAPLAQQDIGQGGAISLDGTVTGGEIPGPGAVVAYSFEGFSGETIQIDLRAVSGADPVLSYDLLTPDGHLFYTPDIFMSSYAGIDRLALPDTGTYTLLVWNYGLSAGPYELSVLRTAP